MNQHTVAASSLHSSSTDGRQISLTFDSRTTSNESRTRNIFELDIFPVVAEAGRAIEVGTVVRIIEFVFIFLQIFFSGIINLKDIPNNALGVFYQVIYIGFVGDYNRQLPFIIALIIIDILTAILFVSKVVGHFSNLKFSNLHLSILRNWHGHLFGIFIIPNIIMIFSGFGIYSENSMIYLFCTIFSVIGAVYAIWHAYYLLPLFSSSLYLPHTPIMLWHPKDVFIIVILFGIPTGFSVLFKPLDTYYLIVPQIIIIGLSAYAIYRFLYFPFKGIAMNVISCGGFTATIISSLISIVELSIGRYFWFKIFISIFVLIAGIIIFYFILNNRQKTVVRSLLLTSVSDEETVTDAVKCDYLFGLNIDTRLKGFMYCQIGLEKMCDLFVDWTLFRVFVDIFENNNDVLVFIYRLVSLFPSEDQFLHSLTTTLSKKTTLSIENSSIFFQAHRIHVLRQTSTSHEASRDFNKISKQNNQAITSFCKFWKDIANPNYKITMNDFISLDKIRTTSESNWNIYLEKYPNNPRFFKEYCKFLIECKCRFKEAAKVYEMASKLEEGYSASHDKVFQHFARAFPLYIKKGIITPDGVLQHNKSIYRSTQISSSATEMSTNSTNNSSLSNSISTMTSTFEDEGSEIDLESFSKVIPQASLRIALQKAIDETSSIVLQQILISSVVRLILTIAYVLFAFLFLSTLFNKAKEVFNIKCQFEDIEHPLNVMAIQFPWFLYEGITNGEMNYGKILEIVGKYNVDNIHSYVNMNTNLSTTLTNISERVLIAINSLSTKLYELETENYEQLKYFLKLYQETQINPKICQIDPNTNKLSIINEDSEAIAFDYLLRLYLLMVKTLTQDDYDTRKNWGHLSVEFCETYNTGSDVLNLINSVSTLLSSKLSTFYKEYYYAQYESILTNNSTIIITSQLSSFNIPYRFLLSFSPCFILFCVIPSIVFSSIGIEFECNSIVQLLKSLPRNECLKASEYIQSSTFLTETKDKSNNIALDANGNNMPSWTLNFITSIIMIILLIIGIIYSNSIKNKLENILEYYVLYSSIRNNVFTTSRHLEYYMILKEAKDNFSIDFLTYEDDLKLVVNGLEQFNNLTLLLNLGYDDLPTSVGFDDELDNLRFNSICDITNENVYQSEFYQCLPFENSISYLMSLIHTEIYSTDLTLNIVESKLPIILHLLNTRISDGFENALTRLETLYNNTISQFHIIIIVLIIISILLSIISFIIEIIVIWRISKLYETFKSIITRIDPISFVSYPQLVSFIYGKSQNKSKQIISASHAIFQTSHNAIISLNSEGIIESLNPATSVIFGYTPEQMLGQNLKILLSSETKENNHLFYTMDLMKSGQCGLTYEANVIGTKDDQTEIPLKITLLGFTSNNNLKVANSFGLMCQDQTQEVKQKQLVEEAKKNSDNLLLQILPKDIITRLNRGDKDISFTVQSSTIIFIDIEKFSEYSKSLSASQIMKNLGMIFTAYDTLIKKYDLILKIKLIGDDYMAAAGLFNPESQPSQHALQVVKFALDCLNVIEELNDQLDANLQVRVGINTGGPLIAGVLGTDKPLFDIIGDPINVAARLQSTDIPGLVQISQGTYDLVCNEDLDIEQRGKIELKGKGLQMTYLVHPRERFQKMSFDDSTSNSISQN